MRRRLIAAAIAWAAAGALHAQPFPNRPIRLVVGFAPAGAADFVSRTLSEPLARGLGQSIVIDNRPGAGSSIAAEYVAKSAPDGYTMLIASPSSILVNPLIMKLGYDAKRDLVPVTKVSSSPLVVAVNPSVGASTMKELIDIAKRQPGKLNFASSGNGAAPHLAAVLFMRLAGVEMIHVPYKGGGPAVQSVLAGETQLSFATPPSVLPLVQAGRLKALAITSRHRAPLVPGSREWQKQDCRTTRSRSGTASSCRRARHARSCRSSTRKLRRCLRCPKSANRSHARGPKSPDQNRPKSSRLSSPKMQSSGRAS
jgi:tripartite-type tricarboxylate transporter receptor subunit TctC